MTLLTIDMGGSAVKYGVWAEETLSEKGNFPTPITWDKMQQELLTLLQQKQKKHKIRGVSLSVPGAVQEEQGIIGGASAIPYIHEVSFLKELEDLFQVPVAMENDANCAALAELWQGNAKDVQNMLFVVLGTGVGGTVVADRKIIPGKHMLGGEFGFMLLTETKTFSDLGTAVQLENRYMKRLNLKVRVSAKEIFDRAAQGDPIAIEEIDTFYSYVAKGIFNLQYCFDPDRILIGGGISVREDLIPEILKRFKKLQQVVPIATVVPDLAVCKFHNDANMIGAVYHFKEKFNQL